jgi:Mg-chelatase subunit ChlI
VRVVQIGTVRDPELRVQIVSERSTFDEDPAAFHKKYAEKQVKHAGALCCAARIQHNILDHSSCEPGEVLCSLL